MPVPQFPSVTATQATATSSRVRPRRPFWDRFRIEFDLWMSEFRPKARQHPPPQSAPVIPGVPGGGRDVGHVRGGSRRFGWRKTMRIELRWVIDGRLPLPYINGVVRWPGTVWPGTSQPSKEYPPSERSETEPKTIRLIPPSSLETCNISRMKPAFDQASAREPSDVAASWACCRASRGVTLRRAPCFMRPVQALSPNRNTTSIRRIHGWDGLKPLFVCLVGLLLLAASSSAAEPAGRKTPAS